VPTHISIGGLVKLHYWAVAENYIVIIAASIPLLNPLVKRGRQRYGSGSGSHKTSTTMGITVQNAVTVYHDTQQACKSDDVSGGFHKYDFNEKTVISKY
jgi:hypothetical protein